MGLGTQTMPNPSHKLRLVRMALGHNVSSRAAAAIHAGGSGGASGVWPRLRATQKCSLLILSFSTRSMRLPELSLADEMAC
jgi:hypothetical protein